MSKKAKKVTDVLQNNTEKILALAKQGLLKGYEFAKKEVPEVLKEIYRYELTISLSKCIGYLLLFLLGVTLLCSSYLTSLKWGELTTIAKYMQGIKAIIGCILAVNTIDYIFGNTIWVKIWLAPRLFYIEYFKKFIDKR